MVDIACAFRPKCSNGLSRTRLRSVHCNAGSIKQAAIHGATVSRLRVIAGPALGFEQRRKTEREYGAKQGGQEKRKRTSRRQAWVRKKGIVGERRRRKRRRRVRGSCKACYPRVRVCTSSTRLCLRRVRLPLPFEINLDSLALREQNRIKRSRARGPRHPPLLKVYPRKVRKRLYIWAYNNAERSNIMWWNDRDDIVSERLSSLKWLVFLWFEINKKKEFQRDNYQLNI